MNVPTPTTSCKPGIKGFLNCGSGLALENEGATVSTLWAAIAGAFSSFGIQLFCFLLLRLRLTRIYRPRSYLVPEKDRVAPPPRGIIQWLVPLFTTSNLSFIQKCGLDAYFFLRFLRALLKFFVPVAVITLPILLPINSVSGNPPGDKDDEAVSGLDKLSISNIGHQHVRNRLWAHLIIAVLIILWFCYIVYQEMRGYIRVRQAYLTSPQHRIRASATTVLVSGIPRKWLTVEALSGLYDVFPGGIKNIWINRNFDKLAEKVELRDQTARDLEDAETSLIKLCRKRHTKVEQDKAKKAGVKKKSKEEIAQDKAAQNAAADQLAQGNGVSAGDQHQTAHNVDEMLQEAEEHEQHEAEKHRAKLGLGKPFGIVNQGFGAVGHGLGTLGKGVGALGHKTAEGLDGGLTKAAANKINRANNGMGFAEEEDFYDESAATSAVPRTAPALPLPETPIVNSERAATASAHETTASSSRPLASSTADTNDRFNGSPSSGETLHLPAIETTRPSVESKPRSEMHIELPESHKAPNKPWLFWKNNDNALVVPSPQPHTADEDEFPLNATSIRPSRQTQVGSNAGKPSRSLGQRLMFWRSNQEDEDDDEEEIYDDATCDDWDEDKDGEPRWRQFIEAKDRQTIRISTESWFSKLPFAGKKVDRIYHLRRELARLNLEIEADQNNVEKYPLMSSAFIQFNHQVAAHMACQSLSHHVPQYMTPRIVEIAPDDVIWDNLSIKWWERYIRTGIVIIVAIGLLILYAIPVTFTSLLHNLSTLSTIPGLGFFKHLGYYGTSFIQGLLPPILLSLILLLVPIIFRLLVKQQGVPTGNAKELGVQMWYFAFLFIQVFFVATVANGLTNFIAAIAQHPDQIVTSLATNLPKASNYFFSYLIVQALSNSASNLLQIVQLIFWFIFAPMFDSTPRQKWRRQTSLNNIEWGSFFPPFANFAVIGIIYSAIAPLILVFMLIIFSLFWIVYRYNVLYVYEFRHDTGGLLFPAALNQLFTGIYFLELCLVGFFFLARDQNDKVACIPQAVIMIFVLLFTLIYHVQLNRTFKPLFQYLPITLEDEAVIRDEAFAKAQASKMAPLNGGDGVGDEDEEGSLQDVLEARERAEEEEERAAAKEERHQIHERKSSQHARSASRASRPGTARKPSLQERPSTSSASWKTDRWRKAAPHAVSKLRHMGERKHEDNGTITTAGTSVQKDLEAQGSTVGDILYSGFADELEDLTPDERDLLVRYAFQHSALRARRPVVWIPRDRLGVSDDEIRRSEKMSTVEVIGEKGERIRKTNIWMSNEGTALDAKGRAVFRRSPPDFSNVDLIAL